MHRVCFLVDGFNVYHSVLDLERDARSGIATSRVSALHWLDIDALCASFMSAIDSAVRGRTVFYFTALAHHAEGRQPGLVDRHRRYITALESTGVRIEVGRFKRKDAACPRFRQTGPPCLFPGGTLCDGTFSRYEEKQTDVAMASRLVELAATDLDCASVVLVGGDSDLVPALRTARRLRPEIDLVALFPYGRYSNEVKREVDRALSIRPERYARFQFPEVVVTARGVRLVKPDAW